MLDAQYLGLIRNGFTVASVALILSGCLLQEDIQEDGVAADAIVDADYELSGSVGDGPVVGAAMRVMQNDGGIIDEFQSDASAGYNITIRTKGKYYPLLLDARGGTDLVTNQPPDFVLTGAALEPSKKYVVNLNPFSTLALQIALDLPGGDSKANVYAAQEIVAASMNFGLVSLTASGPMTAKIDGGNVAEMVKASEALGEVVRRTRDWLVSAGFTWDGDAVMRALGSDLIDGVIDGFGGPDADPRAAAIANLVIAQVLLESAGNELHVNGTDATASLDMAIQELNVGTASPSLGELTVTDAMLEQINAGLAAADAISDDVGVTNLAQSVDGLQPGLQPELAKSILPADYRQTIDDAISLIIFDWNAIATVNEVVRNDGSIPGSNAAPQIAGTPGPSAQTGSMYQFQPTASDPDGDALIFSVSNPPAWANFDPLSGALSGMPDDTDVGDYSGIIVSVTDGKSSDSLDAFTISVVPGVNNAPPQISGTPPAVAVVDNPYTFTPTIIDPNNDPLTITVAGLPAWATFNPATGGISGTPQDIHLGTYNGIVISVSDGRGGSADLGPFSVTVNATGSGSATLTWQPPTQYEDGTPLTPPDFAGYKIYWGTTPGNYPNSVTLNNPGLTTYVVDNLAPGTYEFVATAFNAAGVESRFSNAASKTVP